MDKKLLIEFIAPVDANLMLVEGKGTNGRMTLRGKLQEADQTNGNHRVYPRDILEREITKYINESVKNKTALGELDHPDSEVINLRNTSHLITEIHWEGNNVMGSIELLNTPSGKIAQELILAGVPLGISSRAMGSVETVNEVVQVQSDLSLLTFDLVSSPSTPQAYMRLSEGLTNTPSRDSRINDLITDIICSRTGYCECQILQ